jgi:hypothetical protein
MGANVTVDRFFGRRYPNFIEMTEAVIAGKSGPEGNGTVSAQADTTLREYLEKEIKRV